LVFVGILSFLNFFDILRHQKNAAFLGAEFFNAA